MPFQHSSNPLSSQFNSGPTLQETIGFDPVVRVGAREAIREILRERQRMREEEGILEYLNGKEEDKNTEGDWIVIKC